jgi:hypothetical protein
MCAARRAIAQHQIPGVADIDDEQQQGRAGEHVEAGGDGLREEQPRRDQPAGVGAERNGAVGQPVARSASGNAHSMTMTAE